MLTRPYFAVEFCLRVLVLFSFLFLVPNKQFVFYIYNPVEGTGCESEISVFPYLLFGVNVYFVCVTLSYVGIL